MRYDLIVIGAGSGGLNVAGFANRVGLKVLLIDRRDEDIGGDCLNFGCVPSKALIHVSREVYAARKSRDFGLEVSGEVDMKKVVSYIRSKKDFIRAHENASYFREKGMDVVLGEAKFAPKNSVVVDGKEYFGKRIVIATGGRPRELKVKGSEFLKYGKNLFNNENVFDLERLPKRLVVVGGGPIGVEIGQALSRLGSKVTYLIRDDKFLPKEDPEIAGVLLERLKAEGIEFRFKTSLLEVLDSRRLLIKERGEKKELIYDGVFVGIGRELNLDLDLDKAGVEIEEGRIKVDSKMRTSNKNVFLCGDVAGGLQFTHAAELHAKIILINFFSPFKRKVSYDDFSWVTFSDPEIATFGLNSDELEKRDVKFERVVFDFSEDDRAIVGGYTYGKVILNVSKDEILGGSIVCPGAGEIVQELVLAKSAGLKMKDIFGKIYAYPVASRVNRGAVSKLFEKKLSGFGKRLLRFLY